MYYHYKHPLDYVLCQLGVPQHAKRYVIDLPLTSPCQLVEGVQVALLCQHHQRGVRNIWSEFQADLP